MILFLEHVTPSSTKHEFRQIACPGVVRRLSIPLKDLISRTRLVDIIRHDSLLDCLSRQDGSRGRKIQRIMMAEHGVDGKVKG